MKHFMFTDNRGIHKHVITLDATGIAAHLVKDQQFLFYWRKGWDPVLAASRSLAMYPVDERAIVPPHFGPDEWAVIHLKLLELHCKEL